MYLLTNIHMYGTMLIENFSGKKLRMFGKTRESQLSKLVDTM